MINNINTDLKKIEELAGIRENENFEFRTFLKGKDSDKIDEIVHRLNVEISNQIDCTACGNCCVKLTPCINKQDIAKISNRLSPKPEQIKLDYIEIIEGEQYFNNLPCSFLKDKKCTIYDDRPEECSEFPYLHKKRFVSRLWGVIDNYAICPIVFNVFEALKTKLNYKYNEKNNYFR